MMGLLFGSRKTFEVPCTVELQQTHDFLQAHVSLVGIEVDVADTVQVHNAPTTIAFGDHQTFERTATVTRATALDKWLTKMGAYLELTELYECGFDAEAFSGSDISVGRLA
jgi:hypothetical protein